jgi:hypothetical protein
MHVSATAASQVLSAMFAENSAAGKSLPRFCMAVLFPGGA